MEVAEVGIRKQESLASRIQSFSSQAMAYLTTITDSIRKCMRQGKELLESSARIMQNNPSVFQMIRSIQLFI